jgi:translation initiation factor 2 alpha subunit (eIF-2alpha)
MIKNPEILEKFEDELNSKLTTSYEERFRIFEQMLKHRNEVLKDFDPHDGLEEKIKLIKRLKDAARKAF